MLQICTECVHYQYTIALMDGGGGGERGVENVGVTFLRRNSAGGSDTTFALFWMYDIAWRKQDRVNQ